MFEHPASVIRQDLSWTGVNNDDLLHSDRFKRGSNFPSWNGQTHMFLIKCEYLNKEFSGNDFQFSF